MRVLACVVVSLVLMGCRRDHADPREPLGARVRGVDHPVLARTHGPHAAVASVAASLPAASYVADQAARGAQVYQATCARCHPPGQLDGQPFAIAWNDSRVSTLYSTLRNTMPQDKPGSLSDEQYVDVIAYLLQQARVPAGSTALAPDTAALRQVRIAVAR